jgi:hypothetical protein
MSRIVCSLLVAFAVALPSGAKAGYWFNGYYFTKGVECDVTAGGLGNVSRNPVWLGCEINPPPGTTTISGLAVCENPGGNQPPGLLPAQVSVSFGTVAQVDPNQVMKNGKAFVVLVTLVPGDVLTQLVSACPNSNYTVTDFVPCSFSSQLTLTDSTGTTMTETYSCTLGTLDQCYSLGFDKKTGLPQKVQYTCTLVGG